MLITKSELEERVSIIKRVEEIVKITETTEPICCLKIVGDAYMDFGKLTIDKIKKLIHNESKEKIMDKIISQFSFTRAVVLDDSYVIVYYMDDNKVVFKNKNVISAFNDLYMMI